MDYDWFLLLDGTPVTTPNLSMRDKVLIDSGLSLLQGRDFWFRNGKSLTDAEWDIIESEIAETAERLG